MKKRPIKEKRDRLEINAVVVESYPSAMFLVVIDSGSNILVTLSGKMRKNFIKIVPGDEVVIEVSPYDLSKGRIIKRLSASTKKRV